MSPDVFNAREINLQFLYSQKLSHSLKLQFFTIRNFKLMRSMLQKSFTYWIILRFLLIVTKFKFNKLSVCHIGSELTNYLVLNVILFVLNVILDIKTL